MRRQRGRHALVEESCAAGSGCFQGKCTAARCSDECTLGEKQGGKTCAPFDIATGKPATTDPIASVHDRARGYLARMKTESLASGGIASARYQDDALTTIAVMDGIGDSALWTGTFLASEALRPPRDRRRRCAGAGPQPRPHDAPLAERRR